MKIYLKRTGDTLVPLSVADHDSLKRIRDGEIIHVEYKKPRNPLFHNKFMSLVRTVYDNQETYPSVDALLNVFKVELGYYDTMQWRSMEIRIPRSISFASMDEIEFEEFYNKAVTMVLHRFLPSVSKVELEAYVNQIARYAE